eukprot:366140-Prorocentrum_lima.AAC.1
MPSLVMRRNSAGECTSRVVRPVAPLFQERTCNHISPGAASSSSNASTKSVWSPPEYTERASSSG